MTRQMMWKLLEPILLLLLAIPMLILALLFMRGYPIHLILWNVLAGWAYVAVASVTEAEVNVAGIATGAACVIAIIGIMHHLAAWLYREVRVKQDRADWPAAWRWRWTLALTAAVVMMFIAGLVGVGLFRTSGWLIETTEWFKRDRFIG